ncbi:MAG: indolepyruvate ferredoxin oxidoreductase subunit alpha, partial [bacterium]|nr:indolepyruvate ferredoxin oxidoreductase subunit alpha [bacterium]
DVAIGAALAGVRAATAMKHVGLNVAPDSLMSQSYMGVNAGLVLIVCDDPGIHSSQNEQDTRLFGRLAQVPVLEPSDAQEALDLTRLAFEISEEFDTPVIVRSTTRLSHTRSPVRLGERSKPPERSFVNDSVKNVALPAHARIRHPLVIEREARLGEYASSPELARVEKGNGGLGIVTLGSAYTYVKEVLPEASILKLGMPLPLPERALREFSDSVERVIVVEELEPVIEQAMCALGLAVEGKAFFPRTGEFSPERVRAGLQEAGVLEPRPEAVALPIDPLPRPPVLCAGCPHMSSYMAMRALGARVMGDIGCYTLAALEPLSAIDSCVAMGCSIGLAAGVAKAGTETRPIVATLGDSTFLHSGIPPLIDAVYNQADISVLILDNHTVAMTGGQDHAATGRTLRGEPTHRVDLEQLVRATGVEWVRKVDSYDIAALYHACRDATEYTGVAVVLSDRPCVLDPVKIQGPPFEVEAAGCTACQACMNLSCPAISWTAEIMDGRHKVEIDPIGCMGCSLCVQVCPSDCIRATANGANA